MPDRSRCQQSLDIKDKQRRTLKEDFVDRVNKALIAADKNKTAAIERIRADIEAIGLLIEIIRLAEELSDIEDTSKSVE